LTVCQKIKKSAPIPNVSQIIMRNILLLVFASFHLLGCDFEKERDGFQIVKTENGAIRLNTRTGEMVALNQYNAPTIVSLDEQIEENEIDPLYSRIKSFPQETMPESNGQLKIDISYRWMKAHFEYKFTISPYYEEINTLIRGADSHLGVQLLDSASFLIADFILPLNTVFRSEGEFGEWSGEGRLHMSKNDFRRIEKNRLFWKFSPKFKEALGDIKAYKAVDQAATEAE